MRTIAPPTVVAKGLESFGGSNAPNSGGSLGRRNARRSHPKIVPISNARRTVATSSAAERDRAATAIAALRADIDGDAALVETRAALEEALAKVAAVTKKDLLDFRGTKKPTHAGALVAQCLCRLMYTGPCKLKASDDDVADDDVADDDEDGDEDGEGEDGEAVAAAAAEGKGEGGGVKQEVGGDAKLEPGTEAKA